MAVVRSLAFYWRDKKAVECSKVKVSFNFNREALPGQSQYEAWTKGFCKLMITASGFTPVGGSYTSNDIERIIAQQDIPYSFIWGGKYFRGVGAVQKLDIDSDNEKGTVTEEVTFEAAAPQITG